MVVEVVGGQIDEEKNQNVDRLLERLHFFGVSNIEQLERIAERNVKSVSEFSRYWVDGSLGSVSRGIGVFYLLYVLASQTKDLATIKAYLEMSRIGDAEDRPSLAQRILDFEVKHGAA